MIKSSQSLIFFLLAFLATFYVVFNLYTSYSTLTDALSRTNQMIDAVVYVLIFMVSGVYYAQLNVYDQTNILSCGLYTTKVLADSFSTLIYTVAALFVFYGSIYLAQIHMSLQNKPFSIGLVETKLWIIIVTCLIVQFFLCFLGVAVVDDVYNFLVKYFPYLAYGHQQDQSQDDGSSEDGSSEDGSSEDGSSENGSSDAGDEEVFHVSNNLYTYDDAQFVCGALDASLATYDQVEAAYNKGAEWCGYGWSADQMALYPTQKDTWQKLQKYGENNDCGRPGINGGFIGNPNVRFGVNCYGKKPAASEQDLDDMQNATYTYPKSAADEVNEAKVAFWKKNADKLLVLNSFNKDQWSEY